MKPFIPHFNYRYKTLLLLILFSALFSFSFAQVRVSGKVTQKNGDGVEGVTVALKGTTVATVTNATGNYNINADIKRGSQVLEFSGVGFKTQQVSVSVSDGELNQNVTLAEDALNLDEVIVTGTSSGTTRRQLGSYISSVSSDQLTKGSAGNVLGALQGKTAGAQIIQNNGDPAGGMSVRLRGISSISSSSEPLYIIDGVIVNNSTNRVTNTQGNYDGGNFVGTIGQNRLVDINPADIDRIEVLNGAAAAAIYGSRANAGVVQIFTKRGKSGAPVISFTTSFMLSELRKKVEVNRSPVKFGGSVDAQTQDILTPTLTNTTPVSRYDYNDYIFHTAIGTDNNISVSGGNERSKYFVSGSYFFNQGIIKNTDFQRYNFRTNLDQTINKWLSFNVGLNYVNSSSNQKPDGNSFFSPMNSINIIGNFHDIESRDANGNIKAIGERGRVNPVSIIEDIKQKETTSRIIASAGLKMKILKGLTLDYTLGVDNYSQLGTTIIPPFAYNVGDGFFGGGIALDASRNGYASTGSNTFFGINHDINATYITQLSKDFGSTTQVGFSQQYERNNYILFQGRGLAPNIQTVNAAATVLPGADERSELSISGAFIQQNFRYKNVLYLTGALRVDGSSVFGKNQRNLKYGKASASYVLSSSEFWEKSSLSKFWDLFKLRVAFGESGNLTGIGPYARFNTYSSSTFIGRSALNGSNTLANPDVKPERQKEIEFGTDMAFAGNRVSLTMNVYNKKVTDLLINRVFAPTTGYSSFLSNLGSLTNKGFEIVLGVVPVKNKNLSWNLTAIYNQNRNKAINIGKALTLFSTNAGAPVAILEGFPIGVFYGTYFARDGAGNQIKNGSGILLQERGVQNSPTTVTPGRDANGLPTGGTVRKVLGDPNPKWTGSLVSELNYKKWNLRLQVDAVQGVDVWNADWRTRQGVGSGKEAEKEQRGQYPRGYIAGIYAIEEWRIDDGSFTKLREASLSYEVGKTKLFNSLTLSVAGRNLISWDNYKGYDPEVNGAGQSTLLRGIDFGSVPIPRTFSVSLNAKF